MGMENYRCDFPVQVTMTSDGWTSRATDSYITITAVLVVDWKMVNYVLQTRPMPESHTGLSLSLSLSLSLCAREKYSKSKSLRMIDYIRLRYKV